MAEGHDSNPLSHVLDHPSLEVPGVGWELPLPKVILPGWDAATGSLGFVEVQITRFMVMEVVAALIICAIVIPLARHVAANRVTHGRFLNIFEAIILFIRDGIARPAIGSGDHGHEEDHGHGKPSGHGEDQSHSHHGPSGDDFLPYLWTIFFFVLFCNLLGMLPGGASATGNINVTAVLALLTLGTVITAGVRAVGPLKFWTSLVPSMDVPGVLKPILWILMFVIEIAGLFIKHIVLSVRLFANMLAGHIVLAVILSFIAMASGYLTYLVTPASILGVVALSMLELFVAFLQAYIFTFLSALFIGMAVHPH
jgi:F-type H+-transporting ATPase subunit a